LDVGTVAAVFPMPLIRIDILTRILIHGHIFEHQWMEAQVAMFARINNAFGVGKLYLRDGTPKVFI
jgi:hypothetical protein